MLVLYLSLKTGSMDRKSFVIPSKTVIYKNLNNVEMRVWLKNADGQFCVICLQLVTNTGNMLFWMLLSIDYVKLGFSHRSKERFVGQLPISATANLSRFITCNFLFLKKFSFWAFWHFNWKSDKTVILKWDHHQFLIDNFKIYHLWIMHYMSWRYWR